MTRPCARTGTATGTCSCGRGACATRRRSTCASSCSARRTTARSFSVRRGRKIDTRRRRDRRRSSREGARHAAVPGVGCRLAFLDQCGQRKADPWNDHRPPFDAAHPVDALFEAERLDEVLQVIGALPAGFPLDGDRPGTGLESGGIPRRLIFVGAELEEVVVGGDGFIRRRFFIRAKWSLCDPLQPLAPWARHVTGSRSRPASCGRCQHGGADRGAQEVAPQIEAAIGDFG